MKVKLIVSLRTFRPRCSWSHVVLPVALVTLFLLLPTCILFSNHRQAMLREMQKRALASAKTTATLIAMDSRPYVELTQAVLHDPQSIDWQYYASMHSLFKTIQEDAGADYLYTQYKISDDTARIILDSEGSLTALLQGSQSFRLAPPSLQAYTEAKAVTSGRVDHQVWGPALFAHAPIMGKEGEVLGLVSTGFSIATFERSIQQTFFLFLGLFLLISTLVSSTLCIVLHLRKRSLEVEHLTQLGTRRYFEKQLVRRIDRAKSSRNPFSLLMLDIDRFKQVNDTYGHLGGDKILKTVGAIIKECTQVSDSCSRIGGDEFAVILTSSPLEQALITAQTIQNTIEEYKTEDFPTLRLSVSIGVAQWNEGQSTQDLIEQADRALYKAKKQEKNTVSE